MGGDRMTRDCGAQGKRGGGGVSGSRRDVKRLKKNRSKDILWFRREIGNQHESCKAHDEGDNAVDNLWCQDVSSQHKGREMEGERREETDKHPTPSTNPVSPIHAVVYRGL